MTKKEIPIIIKQSTQNFLANERTFLAWMRTSVGIMAFGFVLERFAFLMKKIPYVLGESKLSETSHFSLQGSTSIFGIFILISGIVISLLAFLKYKKNDEFIQKNTYRPSLFLDIFLTLTVILIGLFLIYYLVLSL